MTSYTALFKPITIGRLTLPNRIFMAPLTRSRSLAPHHTQTLLHATYYAQRATAGLIISEATQISQQGQGYAWTPGIFTENQIESWKPVTLAVHNAGGHIFNQLWHVGAVSHNVFQPDQGNPVSSSAWTSQGKAYVGNYLPEGPMVPHPESRELTKLEIKLIIEDYKHAAVSALKAGFDGVELHAANGYLIDQFLRDSVNKRTDEYGGSIENRIRFLIEVVEALCSVMDSSRIGVRLTPIGGLGGSFDSNPSGLYTAAAKALSGRGLAYLHVVRPNSQGGKASELLVGNDIVKKMRSVFIGTFVVNGDFTTEEAEFWIVEGLADAVSFGRLFISNPDLPARIAKNLPYCDPKPEAFFGGNEVGYTDYPNAN